MKVSILHLSDIHLKKQDVDFKNDAYKIASVAYEAIRNTDHFIIAITGDIAFSGAKEEYDIAESFMNSLIDRLSKESSTPITVAMVPGNHDCKLIPKDSVRETIIDTIRSDPKKVYDDQLVELCTKAQSDFFEFRKKYDSDNIRFDDKLWTDYEIVQDNKKIIISAINVAWMSSLDEKQGTLIFPIDKYTKQLENDADLRIALLHHPINWYCQHTYHDFRKTIQKSSNIIMSGHEHMSTASTIESIKNGKTVFLESIALKPHDPIKEASGLAISVIDLNCNKIKQTHFEALGDGFIKTETQNVELDENKKSNSLKPEFLTFLNDPGAYLTHPEKGKVELSDIYIDPEFESLSSKESIGLTKIDWKNNKTIVFGDEQSGKTKSLHVLFTNIYQDNICPVYVDAKSIKRATVRDFQKAIDKSLSWQYEDPDFYSQLEKSRRAILLDNYEEIGTKNKGVDSIIDHIQKNFGTIVFTCDRALSNATVSTAYVDCFSSFKTYILKDFGCHLRYDLIKKWHSHSTSVTNLEYNQSVYNTERVIVSVLGKNLIPSRPLYLLTLLQSTSSQEKHELENSGTSHYYNYLIGKSLEENGVGKGSFQEVFDYLSHLSWFYKSKGIDSLDENELGKFNTIFSETWTTVNLNKQLSMLTKSKILIKTEITIVLHIHILSIFFLENILLIILSQKKLYR